MATITSFIRISLLVLSLVSGPVCIILTYRIISQEPRNLSSWSNRVYPDAAGKLVSTLAPNESHGYVLTMLYCGQQGAGLLALVSQQCWVKKFNLPMKVVEPFVRNSFLGVSKHAELRMSEFIDMNQFHAISHDQGLDQLVTWEQFLGNSPREVIAVIVEARKPIQTTITDVEGKSTSTQRCIENRILNVLKHFRWFPCIVRVVTIGDTKLDLLSAIFGSRDPRDITVVFTHWSWHWDPPEPSKLLSCTGNVHDRLREKFFLSQRLLKSAKHYEEKYLEWDDRGDGRKYRLQRGVNLTTIAVLLRTERIVIDSRKKPIVNDIRSMYFDSCISNVSKVLLSLRLTQNHTKVFVLSDVGRFGSATWRGNTGDAVKKTALNSFQRFAESELVDIDFSSQQREQTFVDVMGGRQNPGYIAALQRVLASRADCIVLVGGGNFIRLAYEHYLRYHPSTSERCIHFVCFNERFMDEYANA